MTRVALNPEVIFRAALRLVDAEGLEALTMRRLAADLGVATMSLYGHVPNKECLLLGVVDLATREIRLPEPDMPPWEAWKTVTREFRRVALLHPNLVTLIVQQPPTGIEGLRTLEVALDALRRAGIPGPDAVRAYRLTASFAIGFVSLECGGYFKPVDLDAGPQETPVVHPAVPRIAELVGYLADWDPDEEFEAAMDTLIAVLSGWATDPRSGDAGRSPPRSPR